MTIAVKLGEVGDGITVAKVMRIFVREGDVVAAGSRLLEVDTEMADIEVPCLTGGRIEKVHVRVGDTVKIGDSLVDVCAAETDCGVASKRQVIHAIVDTSYLIKHYGDNSWRSNPRLGMDTLNGRVRYHIPLIVLKEIAGLIRSARNEISERARSVRGNLLKLRAKFDEPSIDPDPVAITDPLGADSIVDRKLLAIAEGYLTREPEAHVILLTNDCGIKRSVLSRHGRRKRFIRGWHESTCRVAAQSIWGRQRPTNAEPELSDAQRCSAEINAGYSSWINSDSSESSLVSLPRVSGMGDLAAVYRVVITAIVVLGLVWLASQFSAGTAGTSQGRSRHSGSTTAVGTGSQSGTRIHERIRLSVDAAQNRNEQAHRLCESEVNIILAREFQEIERRGNLAAENLSTYGSCCTIIYRLAKEQIWSSGSSDQPAAPAAERAGMTFHEARAADASRVWNGSKWVAGQAGRGVTNADGYTAAEVEKAVAKRAWAKKTGAEAMAIRGQAVVDGAQGTAGEAVEYADGKAVEYAIVLPGQAIQSGVGAVEAGVADGPRSPLRDASSSEAYVQEEVLREVQPVLDACAGELNTALDRYERALRTSTTTLAYELAQAGVGAASMPGEIQVGMPTQRDVDTALRNLGFDGVSIAVSSAFDIPAILNSTLLSGIVGKASQLAATTFARPAAAAAGSAVVAAADGPLPVGDGIAILGGAVTAIQIYSARGEFEKAIKESLAKALPEMKRDVHSQVVERIHVLQAAYQQAQDEIRNQSVSTLGH